MVNIVDRCEKQEDYLLKSPSECASLLHPFRHDGPGDGSEGVEDGDVLVPTGSLPLVLLLMVHKNEKIFVALADVKTNLD